MIEVVTESPLAVSSPDHIMPHGTRASVYRTDPLFAAKLHILYPGEAHIPKVLRILDLGCGGGFFVREMIEGGDIAVGLEGDDWSKNMQRGGWPIISKFLFTCDLTKPFHIMENGKPMKFDVVTSWAVMEHFKPDEIDRVVKNIKDHLAPNGLYVSSIGLAEEVVNGVVLHQTVKPESWWIKKFEELGLHRMPELHAFFGKHYLSSLDRINPDHGQRVGFNITCSANPSLAPKAPKIRLRKKVFEAWAGSKYQKILKRIVDGSIS